MKAFIVAAVGALSLGFISPATATDSQLGPLGDGVLRASTDPALQLPWLGEDSTCRLQTSIDNMASDGSLIGPDTWIVGEQRLRCTGRQEQPGGPMVSTWWNVGEYGWRFQKVKADGTRGRVMTGVIRRWGKEEWKPLVTDAIINLSVNPCLLKRGGTYGTPGDGRKWMYSARVPHQFIVGLYGEMRYLNWDDPRVYTGVQERVVPFTCLAKYRKHLR